MLELNRNARLRLDSGIDADHHTASRYALDQTQLTAIVDDQGTDPKEAQVPFLPSLISGFRRFVAERIESGFDRLFVQHKLH
jgi:hypothetical protein